MLEASIPVRPSVEELGRRARTAASRLATAATTDRNDALAAMAAALENKGDAILEENGRDLAACRERGLSPALLDRLRLDRDRLASAAQGLRQVAALPDPLGEIAEEWRRPNGLLIQKVRVPLGVVAIIYEARPNVTVDAAGLCLKSGNAVILRGGSEAIHSNLAIAEALREGLAGTSLPPDAVQLIPTTDRAAVGELLRLNRYVDVIIPRGGAAFIQEVVHQSTVPVLETGAGVCHVFIDESADPVMAEGIVLNAKTQRPGVCNAMETLLVHEKVASTHLPPLVARLREAGVEIRGCPTTLALVPGVLPATEEDWSTEYLDLILSVRVVPDLDAAIEHIDTYGTRHSEAIVTRDPQRARKFCERVDAAAIYVNASTRFTDGGEFGFGAEIGISTQKLHARGPMGLRELTTTKYVVQGEGQVRA